MLKLQIIGLVGNDATVTDTNGKKVVNFSLAHTEKWKDGQGVEQKRTTWVSCTVWDRPNVAAHIKKGSRIFCEGAPSINLYTGSDQKTKADFRLNVFHMEFCAFPMSPSLEVKANDLMPQPSENPDNLPF